MLRAMQFLSIFLLTGLASASVLGRQAQTTCYSGVYLLVAPGTFENLEPNSTYGFQKPVVDAVLSKIPGSAAAVIQYPENTNVKTGIAIGVKNAQKMLQDYYNACPDSKTALMGYSQGAMITGATVSGGPVYAPVVGASGPLPPALDRTIGNNIVAIVQFGDLNRISDIGINGEVSDKPCLGPSVKLILSKSAVAMANHYSQATPRNGSAAVNWRYYAPKIDEFCASTDGACCKGQINLFAHLGYYTKANIEAASNFVLGKFNGTL